MSNHDGFVIVDKPIGVTSHDVVNKLRKFFNTKAVGHAGTLDPMATGVLVLAINKATKLLTYCVGDDKTYLATIRLGAASDTDDATGTIISTQSAKKLTVDQIDKALDEFSGEISQIPSSYSAIKINGKKAYQLARQGETVELKPRNITIYNLVKKSQIAVDDFFDLEVEITCSSGTYIRAIARDLGEKLKVGGHLTKLHRVSSGRFSQSDCTALTDPKVIPLTQIAQQLFTTISISAEQAKDLQMGRKINIETQNPQLQAAIDENNQLIALVEKSQDKLAPKLVFGVKQ
jgi:tRNA pseudouridine55 synthase